MFFIGHHDEQQELLQGLGYEPYRKRQKPTTRLLVEKKRSRSSEAWLAMGHGAVALAVIFSEQCSLNHDDEDCQDQHQQLQDGTIERRWACPKARQEDNFSPWRSGETSNC